MSAARSWVTRSAPTVAVGVAAAPPAGLQAAVLIDGGFMEAEDMAEVGLPITAGRAQLVEWLAANTLRFPDWDTATRELAAMISSHQTPALKAYVREVFAEIDGEIRELATPDQAADLRAVPPRLCPRNAAILHALGSAPLSATYELLAVNRRLVRPARVDAEAQSEIDR